jgi:hypothetical protein
VALVVLVIGLPEQAELIDLEKLERERVDALAGAVGVGRVGDDGPFVAGVPRILLQRHGCAGLGGC